MERWWARHKIEKGATAAPFYSTGEVSLPFLAGLLLPALGFLRHCLLSPPSMWVSRARAIRRLSMAAAWHAHAAATLLASGHLADARASSSTVELHKGWSKCTTLIPDVDYEH